MPIYEYKCLDCQKHVEIMQKISDAPLAVCENCGGKMEKQLSLSGFQFKGEGWYVTDYSKKFGGKETEKAEKPEKTEKSSVADSTAQTETASKQANDTAAANASSAKKEKIAAKE